MIEWRMGAGSGDEIIDQYAPMLVAAINCNRKAWREEENILGLNCGQFRKQPTFQAVIECQVLAFMSHALN
jgi:hypothetical protein